jgi:hypothetical protein
VTAAGSSLDGRVGFLVGARRSGTNWLHALMALHPELVRVPSETHLFYTLARLQERFQHGLIGSANTGAVYLPREDLIAAFRDLCDKAFAIQLETHAGPGQLIIERTPFHALHLDLIGEVYPNAPVVHVIRDGREVAESLVRQPWGPNTLADAAAEWVDTITKARAHRPARYHEVRHEDLVDDVAEAMTGVFDFLGVETTEELRHRLRVIAPRPVNATAAPGVVRPALNAAQRAEIDAVAAPLLRELGYETARSAAPARPADGAPETRSRRLAGLRRRGPSDPQVGTTSAVPSDEVQRVIDQMLAALEQRDTGRLAELLSPAVAIRRHDTGEIATAAEGVETAANALIDAAAPDGRQVRGDVYPGRPAFTVVLAHDDGGRRTHRVLLITVNDALLVSRVECYAIAEAAAARGDAAAS